MDKAGMGSKVMVAALVAFVGHAQAQTANAKKLGTMKALIKDVGVSTKATPEDGGTTLVNGLDVASMPFTPESIKQIVVSYQPQVQGCYEEAMAGAPAMTGMVRIGFVITPEGYVKGVLVDKKGSTIKDAGLQRCIASVVSTMLFPKPPDEADHPIVFPFNLKPVE